MKKEIISRFRENPKEKATWWAFGLGLATIFGGPFLGIFAAVIRPMIDKASSENTGAVIGLGTGVLVLAFAATALFMTIRAFRRGERSWTMWVGLIPAVLAVCFWLFMLVGEFVFPH